MKSKELEELIEGHLSNFSDCNALTSLQVREAMQATYKLGVREVQEEVKENYRSWFDEVDNKIIYLVDRAAKELVGE